MNNALKIYLLICMSIELVRILMSIAYLTITDGAILAIFIA